MDSNADGLLKSLKYDEEKDLSQLRIFLGMCAGVGKTFSMLKAAHLKKREGFDVVIGIVEDHGRLETAQLLEGLEVIARKKINYRGTDIDELDLEAVLKRKPDWVIVDELAHTNAPGLRHEKRYQDVQELLRHGISVFTALNVQHIESRKDAVEAITGIRIHETVPDSLIERASQVEVVDIAPSELLKRLRSGKVYLNEKAQKAELGFFKEDKLTALREIALRMTAEKVDQDLQKFSTNKNRPWPTNERILVAVSHSPYSEKVIRAARRLAYNLEAPWIAVHIDTGLHLNDEDQAQLLKNLNLAKELNAEVITTTETDLTSAITRLCRQKNVTQVIVGRPTRSWIRSLLEGGSLLKKLIRENQDVDVHVIRHESSEAEAPSLWQDLELYRTGTGFIKYWNTLWFIMAITVLSASVESFIGYRTVGFLFLLGVMVVGLFGSLGAVLFAAILSAVIWNLGFIPPKWDFVISEPDDLILCIVFFVAALIIGFLTNRIRFHEKIIRDREERTTVLYQVLQDITGSQNKREFIDKIKKRVGDLLGGECTVLLKNRNQELDFSQGKLEEKEKAVALWAFENQRPAGWSTETLSQSRALYIPLKGINENIGVFILRPERKIKKLTPDQEALLYSITGQLGISIERHFLSRRVQETQRLKDSEVLHQTLLNSISHEVRTPLTAIVGIADALEKNASSETRALAQNLSLASERLNRVIENLLDMSRLNSGVLALSLDWQDVSDLVGVTLKKLSKNLENFKVQTQFPNELPLLKIDFRLLEHALANLILNATQYAPKGSTLGIHILTDGPILKIQVEDEGPGIPEQFQSQIFEKFFRIPGSPTGGTGLGLSIVKSIIELHRGQISVRNKATGGAQFTVSLPIETQPAKFLEEA